MTTTDEKLRDEVGATSGRTHREVLESTVGHERAHRALNRGGPPDGPGPYYDLAPAAVKEQVRADK